MKNQIIALLFLFSFLLSPNSYSDRLDALLSGISPGTIELSDRELILQVAKSAIIKEANRLLREHDSNLYITDMDLGIDEIETRELPDGFSKTIIGLTSGYFIDSKGERFRAIMFVPILKKANLLSDRILIETVVWQTKNNCFDDWFPGQNWTGKCSTEMIQNIKEQWNQREIFHQAMANSL